MKVTDEMVTRFLGWKLPEDFQPDCGISFTPHFNVEWNAKQGKPPQRHEPVGTNLFTATQAKAMLEHVLALAGSEMGQSPKPLTPAMDNVLAWRLGEIANAAVKESAGDLIDRGLALLNQLNQREFQVTYTGKKPL